VKQRTIDSTISCKGVGLHSGKPVMLTFYPAPEGHGVVFRRVDVDTTVDICADVFQVVDTRLSTCIATEGIRVATIEHLMSAIAALGIDNLIIDIDGPEVPIMDGSAAPFVFLLQSAGIQIQKANKRFIKVTQKVEFHGDDGQYASFTPSDKVLFQISMDFGHQHPSFSQENCQMRFDFSSMSFQKSISRARTFGFLNQYEALRRNNLALGGGLHNAIVYNDFEVMNKEGLRFTDEPLRHKLLDVIGDLYLAGAPIVAEFIGHKTGHYMNNMLLRTLMQKQDAWECAEYNVERKIPIQFNAELAIAS